MTERLTGHVISHTHWDRAWYWTFQQTRVRLLDLMDDLLDLLERDRGYKHFVLDGQLAMALDYLELRPERTAQLRRLAGEGRLLLGPFFVLPDLFIPTGESLVRNLRAGHEAADGLGPVMKLGYLPDPFGHPAQLPQILRGFGIEGMVFSRGMGDEGPDLGADFLWEAPDGSQILATHQVGGGYGNLMELGRSQGPQPGETPLNHAFNERGTAERALANVAERVAEMSPLCPHGHLLLNNGCDHLPAQPELASLLRAVNRRQEAIRLRHSTPLEYQRAVRRAVREGFKPQVHHGELRGGLYNNLLPGVLSARVDLKLQHDACETLLLRWAEPWSAATGALGLGRDDRAALSYAWRQLLLCQPHDDICGCSIDEVHDDDLSHMAHAEQIGAQVRDRALAALAGAVERPAALVFNPHPWPVRAVVEAPGCLVDCDLPPTGWAPLRADRDVTVAELDPAVTVNKDRRGQLELDNGLVRLRVTPRGAMSLRDLRTGLSYTRVAELVDEGDAGDTYDFAPPRRQSTVRGLEGKVRIDVTERGPLRAAVALRGKMQLPRHLSADRRARSSWRRAVPVTLRVSLTTGSPVVSVELTVDNTVDDHRLRLSVQTPVRSETVLAGAPFMVVERPADPPPRPDWFQPPSAYQPFTDFFCVESAAGGLAVLAPGLREMEVQPGKRGCKVLLTLLRSVGWLSRDDLSTRRNEAGPCFEVQGARQRGAHRFRLGLLPYAGTWSSAEVPRRCAELAAPPRVLSPGTDRPSEEGLPVSCSLLSVEPACVSLAALIPRAGGAVEARLVNLERTPVKARLTGALLSAGPPLARPGPPKVRRAGLDGSPRGRPINPRSIRLGPCEIVTLLMEVPGP